MDHDHAHAPSGLRFQTRSLGSERSTLRATAAGRATSVVGTFAATFRRMDPIFFGLKRAFHSTVRVSRRDFQEIALTPARMDILHALFRMRKRDRPMLQSTLRRILGYTARSTLTQILKALETLNWIRRKRSPRDARQLEVELTQAGRGKIVKAYLRFFPGWSLDAPLWAKGWPTPSAEESTAWDAYVDKIGRLEKILSNIRFALRDTGSLRHRWSYD